MDFEDAACLLEGSNDYRLLRRVPDVAHWSLSPTTGETRRAVLIDTETTGLEDSVLGPHYAHYIPISEVDRDWRENARKRTSDRK